MLAGAGGRALVLPHHLSPLLTLLLFPQVSARTQLFLPLKLLIPTD